MSDTYPEGDPFADPAPATWPALIADPFTEPLVDPATGEILDPEPIVSASPTPTLDYRAADLPPGPVASWAPVTPGQEVATLVDVLPVSMAGLAAEAVVFPARGELAAFAGNLGSAVEDRINALYGAVLAKRPAGKPTEATVGPEVELLANISDLGKTLGTVFARMDTSARSLLQDVVLEVRADRDVEKRGGSASVRVGVRAGEDVKVTATQPTVVHTDTPGIVDVLVPHLLDSHPDVDVSGFAAGARAMAAILLGLGEVNGLLASPKWKSTALDALRNDIERAGTPGLPGRLDAAYGRKPSGNVQTTVERVDPRKRAAPRTITPTA